MIIFAIKSYIALVFIFILDKAIIKYNKNGRWFQLHALCNLIITFCTFHDVQDCILYPPKSSEIVPIQYSAFIALMLHIYHCLKFEIRNSDWIHHISSVFITTPVFIYYPCKGTSFFLFVATGLPGAIDYIGLVLYKNNIILKYTQKHINTLINTYIRMPGGTICSYLLFKDSIYGNNINILKLFLSIICYCNTSYYGKQSIQSFERYKYNML